MTLTYRDYDRREDDQEGPAEGDPAPKDLDKRPASAHRSDHRDSRPDPRDRDRDGRDNRDSRDRAERDRDRERDLFEEEKIRPKVTDWANELDE